MFSVFEALNTKWEKHPLLASAIPFSAGLEYRTVAASFIAGIFRGLVENPFEYAKVKRQTGQSWCLSEVNKGLSLTIPRGAILTTVFFSVIDTLRRNTRLLETQ